MTMAITVSHQNDAGWRACATFYWENLVLVVFPVESKGLYSQKRPASVMDIFSFFPTVFAHGELDYII